MARLQARLQAAEKVCLLAGLSLTLAHYAEDDVDRALYVAAHAWREMLETDESLELHAREHLSSEDIGQLAEEWPNLSLPTRGAGRWQIGDYGRLATDPNETTHEDKHTNGSDSGPQALPRCYVIPPQPAGAQQTWRGRGGMTQS